MTSTASLAAAPREGTAARRVAWPAALMFASGAAGLVWQMVWTAQLGIALGHEFVGALAVVAAFFGGLAAGAALLARRIERSARPAHWYAALEALVAGWALLVLFAFERALPLLARAIGPEPSIAWHWSLAFGTPFLLLLPATAAMGATLPALERVVRGRWPHAIGTLYASNTAGAFAGLLLAVWYAIPVLGLRATTWTFAGVNAACALVAWLAWRRERSVALAPPARGTWTEARRVGVLLLATGALGIGYEVVVLRVLAQVSENTVYTYALLLAVFLAATAAGAAWLRPRDALHATAPARTDQLLTWLVLAMAVGAASLWQAQAIVAAVGDLLGGSTLAAVAAEAAAAGAALAPPALVMGALFTHLCQRAQAVRLPLGTAMGLNTLGAALAPVAFGVLLVPHAGARWTLALLVAGYLALRSARSWHPVRAWGLPVLLAALVLAAPPLRFVDVPEGGRIASYREGVLAAVSVVEDADGVARLHIDNRVQEGSSASGLVETRLAQLPLLLHPAPRNALFLGLGTGYTARAAGLDPALQVDAVELVPEVIAAAGEFADRPGAPQPARPLHVVAADARRFVQATPQRYDVIVADLFHPARNGAGSLYTVEHFAAIRDRLREGGVFCQWLALHQMDLDTLRSIVGAFLQVHPGGYAVLASNSLDTPVIGLVAQAGGERPKIADVERRLQGSPAGVLRALQLARLDDAVTVLGSAIAGPQALQRFAAGVPANRDDRPLVTYRAPWATYAPEASPRGRLAALLREWRDAPRDLVAAADAAQAPRLAAYWRARADYLRLGLQTRPDADPRVMLRQLEDPLRAIVATSPDFHPAADALRALSRAAGGPSSPSP